jgi:drug/metabolite transporter (DMT)-like permease
LLLLVGILAVAGGAMLLANRSSKRPEILLALVVGMCFGAGSILTKALTVDYSGPGNTVMTWSILVDPMLLAVVTANVAGLILLQAAFQRGRAAVIVPLQLALANAVTVLAGVLIFAEHITTFRATGIALIVLGTALLHIKPHKGI